jgi:decaprenylphospho-beta-D-ribofuranose 2-oxidase
LTQGGAGLTGIITKATLRTLPLPGTAVEVQALPVKDLREAADVLRAQAKDADCLYSWNDLNLRGTRFGRGLVFSERFVDAQPQQQAVHATLDLGTRLPFRVWNRAATTAALAAFYRLHLRSQPRLLSLQAAAFPIYGKEYYYAAFGRGGFREYQLIVPFEGWSGFITSLEQQIERARVPVTLGSLKLFHGESQNLRFCMDGICLALDVPASRRASALFEQLDKLAIQFGAVVNLSKDSRLTAELCQQVFPEYDSFRMALARFDAKRRYQSRLRTQVGV